ncbi:MAG: hypothetical protein WC924_01915 [Candidatus Gracilibacteria bacterium]
MADDVEVRRAERGIKPNGKINRIPFGFIANFLLFAEGKTSKFPVKESDNFPCEARLCPKAITNKALGSILSMPENQRMKMTAKFFLLKDKGRNYENLRQKKNWKSLMNL